MYTEGKHIIYTVFHKLCSMLRLEHKLILTRPHLVEASQASMQRIWSIVKIQLVLLSLKDKTSLCNPVCHTAHHSAQVPLI